MVIVIKHLYTKITQIKIVKKIFFCKNAVILQLSVAV